MIHGTWFHCLLLKEQICCSCKSKHWYHLRTFHQPHLMFPTSIAVSCWAFNFRFSPHAFGHRGSFNPTAHNVPLCLIVNDNALKCLKYVNFICFVHSHFAWLFILKRQAQKGEAIWLLQQPQKTQSALETKGMVREREARDFQQYVSYLKRGRENV